MADISCLSSFVIFITSLMILHAYPNCNPGCPTTKTCVSNVCVSINDGTGPCSTLNDCKDKDPAKADCVNSKCICNPPYMWSWFAFVCKGANNGSAPCTTTDDCIDPPDGSGVCKDGKCVCAPRFGWDNTYRSCANPNNGWGCATTADCIDHTIGFCQYGHCLCPATYVYSNTQIRCIGRNGFGITCNSLSDCQATDPNAFCDGQCKCQPGYVLKKDESICKLQNPNDGATSTCSTDASTCFDSSERAECFGGKCRCINNCFWDTSDLKCRCLNDNTINCGSLDDCYDYSNRGLCKDDTHKCTCADTCSWNGVAKKCICGNVGWYYCDTISQCIDQSSLGVCTDNHDCACIEGLGYDTGQAKCRCAKGWYSTNGDYPCTKCASGQFLDAIAGTTCSYCAAGKYSPDPGYAVCVDCAPGNYSNSGGSTACTKCEKGTYQDQWGKTGCIDCLEGTATDKEGTDKCPPCIEGTYTNAKKQFSCIQCLAGQYQDQKGKTECIICPEGKKSTSSGAATCETCYAGTFAFGEGNTACTPCNPGSYQKDDGKTGCDFCPAGTATGEAFYGASVCTACSAGSVANGQGNLKCTDCPEGEYQNEQGKETCILCPAGTFASSKGTITCPKCSAGTITSSVGGKICTSCLAGTISANEGGTTCTKCPAGSISANDGGSICTKCPPGKISANEGGSICTDCPAGSISANEGGTTCTKCPAGSISANDGGSICTKCSAGKISANEGGTTCTDCPAGKISANEGGTTCTNCPAGKISANEGGTTCTDCPAGSISANDGGSTCTKCLAGLISANNGGSICTKCPAGKISANEGGTTCTDCPAGKISANDGGTTCTDCQAGTISANEGGTTCTKCPAGSISESDGSSVCTQCPGGKISANEGGKTCTECSEGYVAQGTGNTGCTICDYGKFQSEKGKEICESCPEGTIANSQGASSCSNCPKGTYISGVGNSVCLLCSKGAYQSNEKQTHCEECPGGTISKTDGADSCTACNEGTVATGTNNYVCQLCPVTQFQSQKGKEHCDQCPEGTFANEQGLSACKICAKGSFSIGLGNQICTLCNIGEYQNEEQKGSCKKCPPGYAINSQGAENCDICLKGTFATGNGNQFCSNCAEGSYAPSQGTEICTKCEKGKYQSLQKKDSCDFCPEGTSTNTEGTITCSSCSPGTFASGTGNFLCTSCAAGKYQDSSGNPSCLDCLEGTYASGTGYIQCTECVPGTFQNEKGQDHCKSCDDGTININLKSISSSDCTQCSSGTHSNSGHTQCLNCAKGTYQDEARKGACKQCEVGKYINAEGATSCLPCPPLSEATTTGHILCDCIIGAYLDITKGTNYCLPCDPFCRQCSGTSSTCSECKAIPGIYQYGTQCLCELTNGFFLKLNPTTNQNDCIPCHILCSSCYGTSNTECTACAAVPTIKPIAGNTCSCMEGTFLDVSASSPSTACGSCYIFCKECSGYKTCSKCIDNPGVIPVGTSCECANPHYTVSRNKITGLDECLPCNILCETCYGVGSDKCHSCSSLGLEVRQKDGSLLCVYDCLSIGSYYKSNRQCLPCHSDCGICFGPSNTNCGSCANSTLVLYNFACVESCPPNYITVSGICIACYATCNNCVSPQKNGCISCVSPNLFHFGSCLPSCPAEYYSDGISPNCLPCPYKCELCLSSTSCENCVKGYFLVSATPSFCTDASNCPDGTYPDTDSRKCLPCHENCVTCTGAGENQCLSCNYTLGMIMSNSGGKCMKLNCAQGAFVVIDNVAKGISCVKCDSSCLSCDSVGSANCISCNKNFIAFPGKSPNRFECKSCKEIAAGFEDKVDENGNCIEICGDGHNMGKVECDDGNIVSGDGCSSTCEIERGFECTHPVNGKDTCVDIEPPTAKISIDKKLKVIIQFSESVKVGKSENLESIIKLELKVSPGKDTETNSSVACMPNYTFSYPSDIKNIQSITIIPWIQCSLKGSNEFTVTFLNQSAIQDQAGNKLNSKYLSAKLPYFSYMDASTKEAVASSGTTFAASGTATVVIGVGMIMFQSVAVGSLWGFMNFLQMISYLPMLDSVLPPNFEMFLTNYLTMAQLVLPINLLPGGIGNIFSYLSFFALSDITSKLKLRGLQSLSFIYNFADQLVTWIVALSIYLLLKILCKCIPEKKCSYFHKWKRDYEFNAFLRIIVECFLQMTFCSFLNIFNMDISNLSKKISMLAAGLATYLSIGFVVIVLKLLEKPVAKLEKPIFESTFGTLIEGVDIQKGYWAKTYYGLFLIRRLLYAGLLAFFSSYPILQLILIIFLSLGPMIVYMALIRPFTTITDNILNIYNESVLFISYLTSLILTIFDTPEKYLYIIGWILIVFVGTSLLITWTLLGPGMMREIFKLLKSFCYKNHGTNKVQEGAVSETEIKRKKVRTDSASENLENNIGTTAQNEAEASERSANTSSPDILKSPTFSLRHMRVTPEAKSVRMNNKDCGKNNAKKKYWKKKNKKDEN